MLHNIIKAQSKGYKQVQHFHRNTKKITNEQNTKTAVKPPLRDSKWLQMALASSMWRFQGSIVLERVYG